MDINKHIQELQDKASKYDNMRDRHKEHSMKLREAIVLLNSLMTDFNPSITIKSKASRVNYADDFEHYYELMRHGTTITMDLIKEAHTDRPVHQNYALFKQLQRAKGIETRKSGTKIQLYMQKEE